jgi:hypothetical protein
MLVEAALAEPRCFPLKKKNRTASPHPKTALVREKTHPFIMGAWKKGPLAALVVCPTSRGRTEVQIPRAKRRGKGTRGGESHGNSGFQRVGLRRKSSRARRLVRVLKMNARSLHPVRNQAPDVVHEPSKAACRGSR